MGVREKDMQTGTTVQYDFKQAHGFRKFFKSEAERFIKSIYVEIFMGHSTGITASYMKPRAEELAEQYTNAIPVLSIQSSKNEPASQELILATFNKQFLQLSGYTEDVIAKFGDLSKLAPQQIQELIREKSRESLGLNGNGHQKIVPMSEIKTWISEGWEYVKNLTDGDAIISLPR